MSAPLNRFIMIVLVVWAAGTAGALYYSQQQNIPAGVAWSILPALLVEVALYLGMGSSAVTTWLGALGERLPYALVASAVGPYLLLTVPLGSFSWTGLLIVAGLAAMVAWWYRVWKPSLAADLLFLVLVAGVVLSKIFAGIYVNPAGKPDVDIVGRMMWIRLGVTAVLLMRGAPGVDFGFLPRRREWIVGAAYCAGALLLLIPMALGLGIVQQPVQAFSGKTALTALATFAGALWFIALSEELFFRGLLQQWLSEFTGSPAAGLVLASVVFGSVHLPYRYFPNWRHALIATVLGVFCGLAYSRAGLRGAMVTHALVVTAWRVAFR